MRRRRCVQDRGAELIPPIVPERGCVELVRKFMQGDYYIGRGSRERNLEPSVFGNPFKVAVHGRIGAIRRYEDMLRKNDDLLNRLPQLPCRCRANQACLRRQHYHGVQVIVPSCVQPRGHLHSSAQRRSPESSRGTGWVGTGKPMQIGSGSRRDTCDGRTHLQAGCGKQKLSR